jgi:uncharacterized sporulation protein YeaH/YhbH (DUF444 family)
MSNKRSKNAGEQQTNSFVLRAEGEPSVLWNNSDAMLAAGNVINPPGTGGDRTGPDRERYRERQKGKAKKKIGDILAGEPVITRPGKIKIPVDGGYEPRWRPGRDGGGGKGKGKKAGEGQGEYVEVTWEEFIEMFFEAINLPNLLKKQFATSLVKTTKRRGVTNVGPRARLNKRETAKARLKRASALKNAQPDQFVDDFAGKCQAVFEAYIFWAANELGVHGVLPEPVYKAVEDNVEAFLNEIEFAGIVNTMTDEEIDSLRRTALEKTLEYLEAHREKGVSVAPYTVDQALQLKIETYVFDAERVGREIPSIDEVPFQKTDFRYNRVEERDDPDSKCAVWLVLDRSGSMSGDPLVIAKAWFFINVLFLRTKYKDVQLILISHDGVDYLWNTEEEFFKIGAGGGTVAAPAWDLVYLTAEFGATCKQTGVSRGPFPRAQYNRYMFHATDGALFDGRTVIQDWWTKIIRTAKFNYCGYLEVGTSWFGGGGGWNLGGEALLGLPADVKQFLGMARANSLADVPDAFVQILTKDRVK